MTLKDKIKIVDKLSKINYEINTRGWVLRLSGDFVKVVMEKLRNNKTEEEVLQYLNGINTSPSYPIVYL